MVWFTEPVTVTLFVMFPSTSSVAAYPGSTYVAFRDIVMLDWPDSTIMGRTVSGTTCIVRFCVTAALPALSVTS